MLISHFHLCSSPFTDSVCFQINSQYLIGLYTTVSFPRSLSLCFCLCITKLKQVQLVPGCGGGERGMNGVRDSLMVFVSDAIERLQSRSHLQALHQCHYKNALPHSDASPFFYTLCHPVIVTGLRCSWIWHVFICKLWNENCPHRWCHQPFL